MPKDVAYAHYLVSPESPVMKVIEEAKAVVRAFREGVEAFRKELPEGSRVRGVEDCYVSGVNFPGGEHPYGWRYNSRRHCAVPNQRIKAGKLIQQRIDAIPRGLGAFEFERMLGRVLGRDCVYDDERHHWWSCGFEKIGEDYVLSAPAALNLAPPGCTELRMSEYWRMREAAGELVSAAKEG